MVVVIALRLAGLVAHAGRTLRQALPPRRPPCCEQLGGRRVARHSSRGRRLDGSGQAQRGQRICGLPALEAAVGALEAAVGALEAAVGALEAAVGAGAAVVVITLLAVLARAAPHLARRAVVVVAVTHLVGARRLREGGLQVGSATAAEALEALVLDAREFDAVVELACLFAALLPLGLQPAAPRRARLRRVRPQLAMRERRVVAELLIHATPAVAKRLARAAVVCTPDELVDSLRLLRHRLRCDLLLPPSCPPRPPATTAHGRSEQYTAPGAGGSSLALCGGRRRGEQAPHPRSRRGNALGRPGRFGIGVGAILVDQVQERPEGELSDRGVRRPRGLASAHRIDCQPRHRNLWCRPAADSRPAPSCAEQGVPHPENVGAAEAEERRKLFLLVRVASGIRGIMCPRLRNGGRIAPDSRIIWQIQL